MDGQMSQEEIDLLINHLQDDDDKKAKEQELESQKVGLSFGKQQRAKVENNLYKTIDFRKPNKLQYDNLGALKQIHEQFAKSMNNYLTMFLRSSIQVDADFEAIEQLPFQQYNNLTSKSNLWGVYSVSDKSQQDQLKCFLQFETAFCDFFIDRSFGGSSEFTSSDDDEYIKMADINKEISKTLFQNLLSSYEQSWNNSNIANFSMHLLSVEDNVQNVSLGIMSSEMVLIIPIKISIFQKHEHDDDDDYEDDVDVTFLKIGIPYSVIEPVLDKLNMSNILASHKSIEENVDIKNNIQHMHNNVEVFVGQTDILFSDLIDLSEGDIISFEKKITAPFDMYIGGIKKYIGKPYKIGKRICIKIIK